jgi:hypothetical protein
MVVPVTPVRDWCFAERGRRRDVCVGYHVPVSAAHLSLRRCRRASRLVADPTIQALALKAALFLLAVLAFLALLASARRLGTLMQAGE